MAGALEAILALTLRYANERVAFERADRQIPGGAAQSRAARRRSRGRPDGVGLGRRRDRASGAFDEAVFLEAASAKIRAAEAAEEGAAIAHQVHGAIGFTNEHILHRFTLRLLAWRDDFGDESHWAAALGNRVAARGADEFWPLVAAR